MIRKHFAVLASIAFLSLYASVSAAAATDAMCQRFNDLLLNNQHYGVSFINHEIKGAGFTATSFYIDASKSKLYTLFFITTGTEYYEAGIQLYPEIKVDVIAQGAVGEKEYPKEIQRFLTPLKHISNDKWKGENKLRQIYPIKDDPCNPLVGTIAGEQFPDGKPRLFLHHYVLGHRGLAPKLGCESWGSHPEQFVFYDAFLPQTYTLKTGHVYVDARYGGIDRNGKFEYPCRVKEYIQAREKEYIQAREKTPDNEPDTSVPTSKFLEEKGLISSEESKNIYVHPDRVWEWQVLRNISEGRELFDR